MVKKEKYIEYCWMILIPLGRTEMKILNEMCDENGWFDEEAYLERMSKLKLFVTNNQKKILSLMPQRYEHRGKRKRRLEALGRFLGEKAMSNYYGI